MTRITKTLAAAVTILGLLNAPAVFAQDQSSTPKSDAKPNSENMQGMMKGSEGSDMMGMMGMMTQMTAMMKNCNTAMEAMNKTMDPTAPDADGAQPKKG